jgi:hypothetical protein
MTNKNMTKTKLTFSQIIENLNYNIKNNPEEWEDYTQSDVDDYLYIEYGRDWVDAVEASPEHTGPEAIDTVMDYID